MKINCQQFEQFIDALVDQTLSVAMKEAMHKHLHGCTDCQQLLEHESKLRILLAQQKVPVLRSDFASHALANARTKKIGSMVQELVHRKRDKKIGTGFFAGFSYALATVVVVWLGVTHLFADKQPADPIQTVSMSLGEVKNVNLVFNSPEVMHDVTVSIMLPDHTELQGRSGVNSLMWKTTLKQGKNIISLPVIAQQQKNGVIVTRISSGNQSKEFKVRLNVNPRQGPALDKAFLKVESQHKGVLI